MSRPLNLKLKDGVEPSVLVKYGFVPKYDEDTGQVKEYVKKFSIEAEIWQRPAKENHFIFVLYTEQKKRGIFRRSFEYEAWMTGFQWDSLCKKEVLQLLYDLIIDGIVEPAEMG